MYLFLFSNIFGDLDLPVLSMALCGENHELKVYMD